MFLVLHEEAASLLTFPHGYISQVIAPFAVFFFLLASYHIANVPYTLSYSIDRI